MQDSSLLEAYFQRIRYSGSREPTPDTLHKITMAHASAIPFENLDVLLGLPVRIDIEAIVEKLVTRGRGGYCFEQNGLLFHVLGRLGFTVKPLSARVRLQRPREFTPPRTHVFIQVEIDKQAWLTDVGVGGASLTAALRLDIGAEQETPHETRRIIQDGGRFFHQALFDTGWADVCEFTLEEMPPIDQELANWFTSAHPKSHFKDRLIVARAGGRGTRYTLVNREFSVRHPGHPAISRILESPRQLTQVLRESFGLDFPEGTEFQSPGLDWT